MAAPTSRTLELDAPAFDPLALQRAAPERYPFLLQTLHDDGARDPHPRWDILFAEPGATLALDDDGAVRGPHAQGGFLGSLDAWFAAEAVARAAGPAPFHGGWFLYLGYELAAEIEPRLRLPRDPRLPVALAVRCRAAVARDRASGRVFVSAEAEVAEGAFQRIADDVRTPRAACDVGSAVPHAIDEDPPADYLAAVDRARRYIHDGDVFQANLSRAWRTRLAPGTDVVDLYARLRESNPAPFAGLARLPGFSIASSSPERLVEVRGRQIATRPIAGTRRRDPDPARDRALVAELVANPKERAEHVMLIDLERNDLSRVCVPGSVKVSEMMAVESYATVHHIVSNVVGELVPGATPGAVIRATFPGGTITGCPKVRCMEIIAELERGPRGPYTGSMGYLGVDGDLDLNILIRSALVVGAAVELRAGAGIVDESDPAHELQETRHKARGLLRALAGDAA